MSSRYGFAILVLAAIGCSGKPELSPEPALTLEEQYEALIIACRTADEDMRSVQFEMPSKEPGWDALTPEEQAAIRADQNVRREASRKKWEAAQRDLAVFEREHPLVKRFYVKDSEKSQYTIEIDNALLRLRR
jgi:hypothetical protein